MARELGDRGKKVCFVFSVEPGFVGFAWDCAESTWIDAGGVSLGPGRGGCCDALTKNDEGGGRDVLVLSHATLDPCDEGVLHDVVEIDGASRKASSTELRAGDFPEPAKPVLPERSGLPRDLDRARRQRSHTSIFGSWRGSIEREFELAERRGGEARVSSKLLRDPKLYEHLLRCDRDLARETRERGCLRCGGRLDSATYPRKPQGGPPIPKLLRDTDPDHSRRLSLCCDGCRRRTTPPSVRFLGRRWYLAATVVLVSALRDGLSPRRVAQLRELHDVSRRTLERWRAWWLETFPTTDLWSAFRGRFLPSVDEADVPRALLARFGALGTKAGLVATLEVLAPLGASAHVRRGAILGPQSLKFETPRGGA